jgi:histidyl-tRNA synthetase
MLGRFGYDCPATGFAFEVGRAMLALESQGARPELAGPNFYIIDFTAEKTQALALARRYRDLGAAVARDIISRGLDASLAYARQQRARWVLVIGEPGRRVDEVRVLDLRAEEPGGPGRGERIVAASALLAEPAKYFADLEETGHA